MIYIDTSVLYALADARDARHERARELIAPTMELVTSDHVILETWWIIRARLGIEPAEVFLSNAVGGALDIQVATVADLRTAQEMGEAWGDQEFPLVDRTSFATMIRLGVREVLAFDDHFAVFRFGPDRRRAFAVLR